MVLITRKNNWWITTLNNWQATTWNWGTTAVDLGGLYDKDIDITSYNGSTIGITSFDWIWTYFRSFFAPSELNDASRWQYWDSISSEFVSSLSSFQTSMRVSNWTDTNYFVVEPTTLYSNQYPNTRDESWPYRPINVLYTDRDWYFRSSSLSWFWAQLKPADSSWTNLSASTFATGTMTSSWLYTASAGITVAAGNLTGTQCIMNVTNGTSFGATHSLTGTNSQTTLSIGETWNTTGTPNIINIALTDTASNAASNLLRYQVAGTTRVTISKLWSFNNDVSGAWANSITTWYDGWYNFTWWVWFIKRDTLLGLGIQYNAAVSYINWHIFRGSANYTTTTGNVFLSQNIGTFAPTSWTATYTYQSISWTINQTGGANGITRGLYVNQTLTAAADYRAIDVATGKTHLRDLKLITAGDGLYIKEGTNATMWVATLVAGVVVVSTTKVTATSRIQITIQALGTVTVPTVIGVTARTAGTSFTITSANVLDTSTIAWMIVEPA